MSDGIADYYERKAAEARVARRRLQDAEDFERWAEQNGTDAERAQARRKRLAAEKAYELACYVGD